MTDRPARAARQAHLLALVLLLGAGRAFAQGGWIRIGDPPGPPRLTHHTAAYDPVGDRLLVYKPYATVNGSAVVADEIWSLRLAEPDEGWRLLAAVGKGPGGLHDTRAVFDAREQRLLLYGGWHPFSADTMSNDVHVLSLSGTPTWSAIATDDDTMRVRLDAAVSFDEASRRLWVYGGQARYPDRFRRVFDLWTLPLDGPHQWTQVPITGTLPAQREAAQFAWDAARSRILMHGGVVPGLMPLTDTWALTVGSTARWDQMATTGEQVPRVYSGAIVDSERDRLLLAPGASFTYPAPPAETMVFELPLGPGGEWAPGLAARAPHGHGIFDRVVQDTRRARLIVVGEFITQAYSMSDASGWKRLWPPDPVREPGATTDQVLVSDAEHQAIWWVGGREQAGFGDLWKLDVTNEAQWTWYPQPQPLPADGHAAALDAEGRRILVPWLWGSPGHVFVLGTEGEPTEDLWKPGGTPPMSREEYSVVVDPVRRQLVVFGGNIYLAHFTGHSFDDLWTLPLDEPRAWTRLEPAGPKPSARGRHFAFYDDVQDRMVLIGGSEQADGPIQHSPRDAWALSLTGTPAWTRLDSAAWVPAVEGRFTYDPVVRRLFMFQAAYTSAQGVSQVHTRGIADDDTWMLVPTTGEAPAFSGPIAFAPWSDRLVVASTGATEPWQDETWALQFEHQPVPRASPLALVGARPSPAHGMISMVFTLPATAPVRLELFDLRGARVLSADLGVRSEGEHEWAWAESRSLRPGLYVARIATDSGQREAKVVLLP